MIKIYDCLLEFRGVFVLLLGRHAITPFYLSTIILLLSTFLIYIQTVYHQLNLVWGVEPVLVEEKDRVFDLFDYALEQSKEQKLLKDGDIAVITSGVPLGVSGTTNMIKVQVVGSNS